MIPSGVSKISSHPTFSGCRASYGLARVVNGVGVDYLDRGPEIDSDPFVTWDMNRCFLDTSSLAGS